MVESILLVTYMLVVMKLSALYLIMNFNTQSFRGLWQRISQRNGVCVTKLGKEKGAAEVGEKVITIES